MANSTTCKAVTHSVARNVSNTMAMPLGLSTVAACEAGIQNSHAAAPSASTERTTSGTAMTNARGNICRCDRTSCRCRRYRNAYRLAESGDDDQRGGERADEQHRAAVEAETRVELGVDDGADESEADQQHAVGQ